MNAPNQKEWNTASQILERAIQLIEERGWQQGSEVLVPEECLDTAIEHAFFEGHYTIVDFNYTREALSRVLQVSREPAELPGDPLDVPYWGRNFMEWNDVKGRTKEEVLEVLGAAADLAKKLSGDS
jgi:hypothetical protein